MSPTDAKRGAKRRKNKRGGGSSCSAVCNSGTSSGVVGSKAGVVSALGCAGAPTPAGFLAPATGGNRGSVTGINGELKVNTSVTPQFTEGPVNADFTGVLQTPFTFGLNQRAPYTAGDRCLLCRCERSKDGLWPLEAGVPDHRNGASEGGQPPAALPLPMWVCSDCRRTVEKEDRHTAQEQLGSQDFVLHMPVGNGTLGTDAVAATDRLSAHTSPMLPTPDLATPIPGDTVCGCEACNERREISAESERESQQLQKHWSEVRYLVRCIYRQAGTPLADDRDQPLERDKDGMKELVDRLCEKDPYQLYQRLEQQAREYVLEMKARLLKHLSTSPKTSPGPAGAGTVAAAVPTAQGPPQAHQFVSLLLEEYNALCQAARTISGFLLTLENEHLQKFHVTWELHNKHLFENLVFSEPILHSSLPALVAQLRHGTTSHDSYNEDMYLTLLERYQRLEQEMASVAGQWQECEKRIDDYVDEQLLFKVEGQSFTNQRTEPHKSPVGKNTLKTKQRILKEDWEFFKQRRYIEEQLPNNKKLSCGDNFTDTMRMLSSRLSIPDCPNCNYRRRCTCDDCSLSHILTCGIMDSPISEDLPIKLPLQGDAPPRDYLAQVHPPSLSSGSSPSGSNSSSPITVQRHPRLVLPAGHGNTFVSDDDEVPPMSGKFGDMYPVSGYRDNGVTAVNGHCGDVNGSGGVSAAQNAASPRISSSSSSSDGDEEDMGRQQETNSPPPSYNHQQQVAQVQHACECHVCNQDPISTNILGPAGCLPPGRLQSAPPPPAVGHQFFTDTGKSTTTSPARPALHLYPHIHGHLPMHNFSRPLLHPTLYPPSPPLTHNKPLPPNLTTNHSAAKQPAFSPTLPEHVYQNSFGGDCGGSTGGGGGTGDWNNSLQCLSLNFESLWDAAAMKSLDQSISQVLLPELLQGEILDPPLADVPLPPTPAGPQADHHHHHHHHHHPLLPATPAPHPSSSSSSSLSSCSSSEAREQKKSGAKKKCLYNFQDAFMETNRVALATSASMASVSCTATTVQSSNNLPIHLPSKTSLDDVFHSLGKEDHRQVTQAAPRSNPAALSPLPPLSGSPLPPTPATHLPAMVPQPFPKMAAPAPDLGEVHPGLCLPPAEPAISSSDGQLSAPPSVCSDPECEGHRCEGNRAYEHPPYDGEETQDEDSCSEHSSSTSTSTNQKEGKYCDCCYCEFFGHGGPPAAPTSRNYAEMREKLRLRLTKRKEEQPKREEQQPAPERDGPGGGVEDHRRVEDLLQFINSADSKPASSSKAAKRARHKQKKMEEKARQEAEAQQEEQRRRQEEEEAALQRELLRLQEHCSAKKKRKDKAKENTAPTPNNNNNPQPLKQTAQNVLDHLSNGKSQLLQSLICPKDLRTEPRANGQHGERGFSHLHNADVKVKAKPAAKLVPCEHAPIKKDPEANGGVTPAETKATRTRPVEAPAPPSEPRGNNRSASGKRQLKEDHRRSPPASNPSPSPPLHLQPHLPPPSQSEHTEQNGKPPSAESPQPKGKAKKNKKKKGDKINTSIDDVFLPKDIDLDSTEMDETEREVEYFKRFCLDSARQTRQRLSINWSNFSLKKATFAAH